MCRWIRRAWLILRWFIEGRKVPEDPMNPLPPYLGPTPCTYCGCTGYTPCGSPPYTCGGVARCAQCQHNASRIAQARTQIDIAAEMMTDDQVIAKAEAWGLQVPT